MSLVSLPEIEVRTQTLHLKVYYFRIKFNTIESKESIAKIVNDIVSFERINRRFVMIFMEEIIIECFNQRIILINKNSREPMKVEVLEVINIKGFIILPFRNPY